MIRNLEILEYIFNALFLSDAPLLKICFKDNPEMKDFFLGLSLQAAGLDPGTADRGSTKTLSLFRAHPSIELYKIYNWKSRSLFFYKTS